MITKACSSKRCSASIVFLEHIEHQSCRRLDLKEPAAISRHSRDEEVRTSCGASFTSRDKKKIRPKRPCVARHIDNQGPEGPCFPPSLKRSLGLFQSALGGSSAAISSLRNRVQPMTERILPFIIHFVTQVIVFGIHRHRCIDGHRIRLYPASQRNHHALRRLPRLYRPLQLVLGRHRRRHWLQRGFNLCLLGRSRGRASAG